MSTNNSIEIDGTALGIISIPNERGTPERRLLLAVLERAILDFVGNEVKEATAAAEWLFADEAIEDENSDEFSFSWICNYLDIDRSGVLSHIKALPKRGNKKIAPWYFAKEAA